MRRITAIFDATNAENVLAFDGFEGKLSSKWAKLAQCSQDTALRDIDDLVKRGVLFKVGRSLKI